MIASNGLTASITSCHALVRSSAAYLNLLDTVILVPAFKIVPPISTS